MDARVKRAHDEMSDFNQANAALKALPDLFLRQMRPMKTMRLSRFSFLFQGR